jgi:tetratricopeptide (TPR) repeat protein
VHREQQRSYRRVFAIACAAVLAFGVLAVFTFITITSRRDAEVQRSHAEGLVEFMLGDLRHKLEPEGRLSTLDAVGKEALAYYAAQDPASLDAEALARRARALHMIGDVYDQRGRLDDALGVFKQAAESTAELLARDKSNPQRIFDHAQSVYWVGYIAWQRGQKDTAEAAFQNYKALADRLVTIDPRKADWQAEVEYANSNLGTLLLEQGRASEASAAFERALQISLAISKAAPDDVQRQVEQAQSRAWLADAQLAQGRLREAMQQRQTEIAIYENILAVTPKDHDVTRLLVIGERALGRLSLMLGDIQVAIAQLRDASKLAETLIQVDIENSAWREMDAGVQGDLGEALYYAGERDAAASTVARARELATRLVERDPSVVQWQLHMGRSLLLESRLQAANGDALGALRVAQGVIQRIEALPKANPPDRATLLLHAHSLMVASDQEVALGQAAAAAETRKQVVSLLSIEQIKTDPRLQALRASAERGLGRMEDAAPIVEALEHMGYREPDYVRRTAISEVAQNVTE